MADYSSASPFMECQAILAAQENDVEELDRLLGRMLPNERARLADAAARLYRHANP